MIEVLIFISIIFIILGFFLIFFVNKKNDKKTGLKFFNDLLVSPDKSEIFYKNITEIKLKSIYVSNKGWEPRILITYKTSKQIKNYVVRPQFFPHPNYSVKDFIEKYETAETVFKLRRFVPDKIDDTLNRFLNNKEIKFEELESMDKMIGVEMIKPRGSFRIKN